MIHAYWSHPIQKTLKEKQLSPAYTGYISDTVNLEYEELRKLWAHEEIEEAEQVEW